jgi:hypothetical protein
MVRKARLILPRQQMHQPVDHHQDLLPPPRQKIRAHEFQTVPRERSVPTISEAPSRALDAGEPKGKAPGLGSESVAP